MQAASSKILTKRSSNCSTTNSQMLFPVQDNHITHIIQACVFEYMRSTVYMNILPSKWLI